MLLFPNKQRYSDTATPVTVHGHLESPARFLFYTSEKEAAEYWSCSTTSSQRWPGPTDGFVAKAQTCSTQGAISGFPTQFLLTLANLPASLLCAFPSVLLHEVQSNLPSEEDREVPFF